MPPRYEEYQGDDPLGFVMSKNLHRRHLTESQRALVASNLANMKVGNHSHSGQESNSANLPNSPPPVSRAKAAEMLKVSERLVGTVKAGEVQVDTEGGRVRDFGGRTLAKAKVPFRKHPLKPVHREPFTPVADKPEGVTVSQRGYWPGWNFSDAEKEFMEAVVRWQKKHRSKFLSHSAYLKIALELGYRRDIPTPPTPAVRMSSHQIVARLLAAGFRFTIAPDGGSSFHRPDTDSPEVDALLALVAWRWADLEPLIVEHLNATQPETHQ